MLYRKMLRDLKEYKIQFISIFLMAFLGVFIFAGLNADAEGLQTSINEYYDETNMADGWIYSNYLNDLFVEQVDLLGATTEMERQLVIDSVAELDGNPEMTLHFVENNTLSKFYLIEGKELDIKDSDGVWLDKSFADAHDLSVGDNITFNHDSTVIEKQIRGLGYSPEYVYDIPYYEIEPNHHSHGFAYMSNKAFPGDDVPYNVLNVKFDGNPDTYEKLLDYRLHGYYDDFLDKNEHPSVSEYQIQIDQHKMMSTIFPLLFIVVSLAMLLTTMKRIITHQRTQLGILKANGFKNITLIKHYISYGVILSLLGAVIGLVSGSTIFPTISYPFEEVFFKLPNLNPADFGDFSYIVILIVIVSIIVSYHSINSIIYETPSKIIHPKSPKTPKKSFIEKSGIWNRLPFNIRWNVRDSKRHSFRSIMTILGIIGCTIILMSTFALNEGLENSKEWEFNEINHYESKLIIDKNTTFSQINQIANRVDGDMIMESVIEIKSPFNKKIGSLLVLNDTDLITPTVDSDFNKLKLKDNEVSISKKMADLLNVGVGDKVSFNIPGTSNLTKVKIARIHADPMSQGLIMSSHKLNELGLNYTPTSILTAKNITDEPDGIKSVIHPDELLKGWDENNKAFRLVVYVALIFAIILAIVVIYNLQLLTFIEMEHDIIVLKVLGFRAAFLARLLLLQGVFFTIVGITLGTPISYYIIGIMWNSSSEKYYQVANISPTNLLLTCGLILSVLIVVNIMFYFKIKRTDLVSSTKNQE